MKHFKSEADAHRYFMRQAEKAHRKKIHKQKIRNHENSNAKKTVAAEF